MGIRAAQGRVHRIDERHAAIGAYEHVAWLDVGVHQRARVVVRVHAPRDRHQKRHHLLYVRACVGMCTRV
jgi:hypothetical protein